MIHDEDCPRKGKWFINPECRAFSTDGTALGADIAHTFGTTDEEAIKAEVDNDELNAQKQVLTGMEEEQADWESDGTDDWLWDRPVTME
jgi:hypothetical protein